MAFNRRKKRVRLRGSHTHGWGHKKKHRGAGNRGGKGMAGTGKRADHKKFTILQEYKGTYFGSHGFFCHNRDKKPKIINLEQLNERLDDFVSKGLVKKEKDFYIVNLADLGYQKVLGKGNIKHKIKIKAQFLSEKASQKIQEAGGQILE